MDHGAPFPMESAKSSGGTPVPDEPVTVAGTLSLYLRVAAGLASAALVLGGGVTAAAQTLDPVTAVRFARLALDCVHREYPNKIAHVLNGDDDVRPPHELTPSFYGCYDWHSAVHGHWLLARLVRRVDHADFTESARQALDRSLTVKNIDAELRYLSEEGRLSFERPYGLAWVLQLGAELREWEDQDAKRWRTALEPLEREVAQRIKDWLPKLTYPIRMGEHSQTAFAFGLVLDWARIAGDEEMRQLLHSRIEDYYGGDRNCPVAYEPSGQDFLSPCLAEADLMRRVRAPEAFAAWFDEFLPDIPTHSDSTDGSWLSPEVVTDPSDGKLAHLDGLNLSRAWMLEGIAAGLPPGDGRQQTLRETARRHRESGLAAVTGEHYEGGHWLASFATYLVTERGLR